MAKLPPEEHYLPVNYWGVTKGIGEALQNAVNVGNDETSLEARFWLYQLVEALNRTCPAFDWLNAITDWTDFE